jgi:energy-coupling factor transport system substrate-specific component
MSMESVSAGTALSTFIILLVGLAGLAAFVYPFFLPPAEAPGVIEAHTTDALLVFTLVTLLGMGVMIAEVGSQAAGAKTVAVLGVLTAINAILRLADVATGLLGIGGFSPVFFLIILVGYVYGSRFAFLLGILTLFVSAIITGGVGTWLPYQMFAAGWVGLTAGWLPDLRKFGPVKPQGDLRGLSLRGRMVSGEIIVLAVFGLVWGILFGILMNLFFWPYVGGGEMYWVPGLTLKETVRRYALFYVTTSLWWDLARGIGNFILIAFLGRPVLRMLRRFQRRLSFEIAPAF